LADTLYLRILKKKENMNRRKFIKKSTLTSSGLLLLPSLWKAKRNEDIILGHNNKRYRINTAWSQLDVTKYPVKDCHEMVQDSKGRIILLTNETRNNVIFYDKKGKLVNTWGHEYPGAHGLTLFDENGQEVLFICDNNRQGPDDFGLSQRNRTIQQSRRIYTH
jgi:hypothetical protein